jgi:ATP-dependent exoDNAse (exonuclease V) beta subunit
MVQAGAGTGKTFCVTEGVYRMLGIKRKTEGSEEQQAIWEAMKEDPYPGRIHMTSFTRDASDQLADMGPRDSFGKPIASSKSTYGTGLSYAKAKGQAGHIDIYGNKYKGLTSEFLGGTKFETSKTDPGVWEAIFEIQSKARLELIVEASEKQVKDLADWYGIEIPSRKKDVVVEGINAVLAAGREKLHVYDFVDQVYLPVIQDLVTKRYETIIVDEAQDMGKAQQEICLRCSYRRIIIGDPHQAIFGFAGADSDAFGRLGKYYSKGQSRLPIEYD